MKNKDSEYPHLHEFKVSYKLGEVIYNDTIYADNLKEATNLQAVFSSRLGETYKLISISET